jgi:hypothetical protein
MVVALPTTTSRRRILLIIRQNLIFLEWGIRAYIFLESVVNEEIPLSTLKCGRRLEFADDSFMTQTSGQSKSSLK